MKETTSSGTPGRALTPRAQAEHEIMRMLERSSSQIAHALPATMGMRPETIIRALLTEVRMSPQLAECDPISIVRCAMDCASLGLVPNRVLGHVYPIPFKVDGKMTCTTIVGYRGLADIARRSGNISTLDAYAVHEKDEFDFGMGDKPFIHHKPAWREADPGPTIAFYAVATLRDGGVQRCVMSVQEVEYIRAQSKQPNGKLWKDHYDEAGKKTCIRRLWKSLPVSVEALNLLEQDRKREEGEPDATPGDDLGIPASADVRNEAAAPSAPGQDEGASGQRAALAKRLILLCQENADVASSLFGGTPPIKSMDVAELQATIVKIEDAVAKGGKA